MSRHEDIRRRALEDLQRFEVLMLDGHFDYGNGYHGRVYLNPHQLFRYPSTIWRFAQDLIDLLPSTLVEQTDLVAGPLTGGALLAHTIAGLLDGRRKLTEPPKLFAPLSPKAGRDQALRALYRRQVDGKRVLLADDVRNTGLTFARCATLVKEAGGTVVGTVEIYDRQEAVVDLGLPNIALAEYRAPDNYPADACPQCRAGVPVTAF
jgi:orotate phosphoribosyltransferase